MPGFCSKHEKDSVGWNRYKPRRALPVNWQALRAAVLVRDGYLCQPCRRAGRTAPAHEVDHIINRAEGGGDEERNLQAICMPCHKDKTEREKQRARAAS